MKTRYTHLGKHMISIIVFTLFWTVSTNQVIASTSNANPLNTKKQLISVYFHEASTFDALNNVNVNVKRNEKRKEFDLK